jgi:hypothetical protein
MLVSGDEHGHGQLLLADPGEQIGDFGRTPSGGAEQKAVNRGVRAIYTRRFAVELREICQKIVALCDQRTNLRSEAGQFEHRLDPRLKACHFTP